MVKICLLNATQNATERGSYCLHTNLVIGKIKRERERGKRDGWLFGMRDMFGDKAAAYATYK